MRGMINLLGPLFVRVFKPGASEVKSILRLTASNSMTRATIITPTSGKRVRIISVEITTSSGAANHYEVYFDTGAGIANDLSKAIMLAVLDFDYMTHAHMEWPDGGGPIGDVNDVVSIRTGDSDISALGKFVIHYREE